MITGMHHTGIYCRDIDESIAFYEGIGFRLLFRTIAYEGDKPLKMAWIKAGTDATIELIEQEDKSVIDPAARTPNHVALRVDDMDSFVGKLEERGITAEAGPFDPPLEFDTPLGSGDSKVFVTYGDKGAQLRILFFRGPSNERFEVVQDDIAAL